MKEWKKIFTERAPKDTVNGTERNHKTEWLENWKRKWKSMLGKEQRSKWKHFWGKTWDACKKFLFINNILAVLLTLLSTALLLYAFLYQNANPIVSYISYFISAYTLTVVVIKMPPLCKKIKRGLYGNKYSGMYLSDSQLRARISLYTGCGISIFYACFKLGMGIYLSSVWLGAVAIYYIILSLMRFALLRKYRQSKWYETEEELRLFGLKSFRFCGTLMFLLNIAVSGLVVQMIWQNKAYEYPGFLIYATAAYAFYCLTMAIINIIKYRRMEQPILSAAKMLSFACALISILAMQTAMLTQFGDGQENFARLMNSLTGGAVCLCIFVMAVWMVRKANREIVSLKEAAQKEAVS